MPVYLEQVLSSDLLKNERVRYAPPSSEVREFEGPSLDIGIINNMPDGAMKSTERQFLRLLDSAADSLIVNVTFYALAEVPRSERAGRHIQSFYAGVDSLWDRHLDGLIVTGAEPRTPALNEELYWNSLTGLLEWADHNTYSSIWSCLAAHAAVLHLDGIRRRRLPDKRFGLFQCLPVAGHAMTAGLPARVVMPHSRWNDLSGRELTARGYEILTHSEHAGVDTFVKQNNSLMLFFQGHPEYEANTLLLEYRRDIGRYLRRERDTYPSMPENCLSPALTEALEALKYRAMRDRREELVADFPATLVEGNSAAAWSSTASCIYRNWLRWLCAAKQRQPVPAKPWLQVRPLAAGA